MPEKSHGGSGNRAPIQVAVVEAHGWAFHGGLSWELGLQDLVRIAELVMVVIWFGLQVWVCSAR
jgi:hypothetical protein